MTMPSETPAGSAAPGAANGSGNPSGSASVPQSTPTNAGPEDRADENRSSESLEDRVRHFQSLADKRESELNKLTKKLGPLTDWLDKLGGGDGVMGMIQHYATHPKFNDYLSELNTTGRIHSPLLEPAKTMNDEDEYVDPDIKSLRDELADAKAEIQRLSGSMTQREAQAGAEKFQSYVQKWLGRYEDLTSEEIERVRERGESTVAKLGANIARLSEQDVNTLLRGTFNDDEWDSFMDRRALRRLQNQQQRGTDSPSTVSISNAPQDISQLDYREIWKRSFDAVKQ